MTLNDLNPYQLSVLKALGYESVLDQESGSSSWVDRLADDGTQRIKTPGDTSLDDYFAKMLEGFGSNHGTAGYIDPGSRAVDMSDPAVANAFKNEVDFNGKKYFRGDSDFGGASYDELRAFPEYAKLMDKYHITAQDFANDPTLGKMLVSDPRTKMFGQEAHAKTQKESWLSAMLTGAPLMMGTFGMGALAAPALGAALSVPTSVAKAGLSMIPSLLSGNGVSPSSLLSLVTGALGGGSGLGGLGDALGSGANSLGDFLKSLFSSGSDTASRVAGSLEIAPDTFTDGGNMFDLGDFDWESFLQNPDWEGFDAADPFGLGSTDGAGADPGVDTGNLTFDGNSADLNQWARSWGGLKPDGTIDWDKFGQEDPFGLNTVDDGAADPGGNLGGGPEMSETLAKLLGLATKAAGGTGGSGSGSGSGSGGSGLNLGKLLPLLLGGALGGIGSATTPSSATTTSAGTTSQNSNTNANTTQNGQTQTSSSTSLPDWQQPYVRNVFDAARDALAVALGNNAQKPLIDAGSNYMQDVIGGKYLDPSTNPMLQKTFDAASDAIIPKVNSQFTAAGRTGSGAHTGALGDALGHTAAQIYGNAYTQERGFQNQAGLLAPNYASDISTAAFSPITAASGILTRDVGRNTTGLSNTSGTTGVTTTGQTAGATTGTQTSPIFKNLLGSILSGSLAGGLLGKMF